MAKVRVRYLISKPGRHGPRFFWQPSMALRAAGWHPIRLPNDPAAAIREAERRNAALDAWRRGDRGVEGAPERIGTADRFRPTPGSIDALIATYKASRFWSKLAPKTRREYQWALNAISEWCGDAPVGALTAPLVQAFYGSLLRRPAFDKEGRPVFGTAGKPKMIETPAKAAAVIRVLRLLLGHGPKLGFPRNEAAVRPGITLNKRREPRLWSREDVQAVVAAADTLGWRSVGTAVLLNEWIGQRLSDVLALPRWDLAHGELVLRQAKTRRQVALPVHLVPHLLERLKSEAERPGAIVSQTHLLVNDRTGKPWDHDTFRHVFAEVRDAAASGLPARADRPELRPRPEVAALWFMELRHTAVTRLHEAGVDPLGIAAITGHTEASVRAILDRHYLIRTRPAAERAFQARLAAEAESREPRL